MQIYYCSIENYYKIIVLSLIYCHLIENWYSCTETMVLTLLYTVVIVHILHCDFFYNEYLASKIWSRPSLSRSPPWSYPRRAPCSVVLDALVARGFPTPSSIGGHSPGDTPGSRSIYWMAFHLILLMQFYFCKFASFVVKLLKKFQEACRRMIKQKLWFS
jgi:hypothetical protein